MLEGTLKNLPFTDILQVLANSQKSGVLTLTQAFFRGRVYFDKGRVEVAHISPGRHLGELLVRQGLMDMFDIQTLLARQASDNPGTLLGLLAVEAGYITDEQLSAVIKTQMLDALTELATWTSGSFHFAERSTTASQLPVERSFDTMMLLMEVISRLDSWQPGAVEVDSLFERQGDPAEVELSDKEVEVLSYVDGARPAMTIAAELDLPEKQVYHMLNSLLERGLITSVQSSVAAREVLILSASDTMRQLIHLSLQRVGLAPFVANDVVSAIDFAMTRAPQACVVDDIKGEGLSSVKELRSLSGHKNLPAVLLSKEKLKPAGFFARFRAPVAHVLLKPYQERELQQLVIRLVN